LTHISCSPFEQWIQLTFILWKLGGTNSTAVMAAKMEKAIAAAIPQARAVRGLLE
jgi:hypothetical protein